MDDLTHPFTLEVNGKNADYIYGNTTEPYQPTIRHIERHLSFREAFESLMQEDICLFEKNSTEVVDAGKYYSSAIIFENETGKELAQITSISFDDSPDGSPTAGIYLFFDDTEMHEIEKISGHNFSHFKEYDRDSPFLLLARLKYDKELLVVPEDAWSQLHQHLMEKESGNKTTQEDWKYCICDTTHKLRHPKHLQTEVFHYNNSADSFKYFLSHASEAFLQKPPNEHYTFTSVFHERNGRALAEVFRPSPGGPLHSADPGIYLDIKIPSDDFQQITGFKTQALITEFPNNYLLFSENNMGPNGPSPTVAFQFFTNQYPDPGPVQRKINTSPRIILPPNNCGRKI